MSSDCFTSAPSRSSRTIGAAAESTVLLVLAVGASGTSVLQLGIQPIGAVQPTHSGAQPLSCCVLLRLYSICQNAAEGAGWAAGCLLWPSGSHPKPSGTQQSAGTAAASTHHRPSMVLPCPQPQDASAAARSPAFDPHFVPRCASRLPESKVTRLAGPRDFGASSVGQTFA